MNVADHRHNLEQCLRHAAQLLGGPVRPVVLVNELEETVRKLSRLECRTGLLGEPPILTLDTSRTSRGVFSGIEIRWLTVPDRQTGGERRLRFAQVVLPDCEWLCDFWVARIEDARPLYRALRAAVAKSTHCAAPILESDVRQKIWDNTIGFLHRARAVGSKYDVALKRGVLLLGEPGNGKTMACRWLRHQCDKAGYLWKTISPERLADATKPAQIARLFSLPAPGVIAFDDLDLILRSRKKIEPSPMQATFLTQMDGIAQKSGIVFLFTSNLKPDDLDAAFRRPGRLDVLVQLKRPTAELRAQVIAERWHPELAAGLDVAAVVRDTHGMTFAELEEAKKLLVLRHCETGQWDWPTVAEQLRTRLGGDPARTLGFQGNGHPARITAGPKTS